MALSRYTFLDAYTLEELRRNYEGSDARGRIQLLEKLYTDNKGIPFEIKALAIEDPQVAVRQWIAQHLSFGEEECVKNDPDPFVHACLRENSRVFHGYTFAHWMSYFREATHLERLALVRNPNVHQELIEKIFDPEDKDLAIDLTERMELTFAFLTNEKAVAQIAADADIEGYELPQDIVPDISNPLAWSHANQFLQSIWDLALKWPPMVGRNLPYILYRHIPADDDTKAEIYRKCDSPDRAHLKKAILENCTWWDKKTLNLGVKDADETCRFLAYRKVSDLEPADLQAILKGQDKAALEGLACNESMRLDLKQTEDEEFDGKISQVSFGWRGPMLVSLQKLALAKKVRERLLEMDNTFADRAEGRIEKLRDQIQEMELLGTPDKLFDEWSGDQRRDGRFLEAKIHFIGNKVISMEKEMTGWLPSLHTDIKFVLIMALIGVIGIGVLLFR